MKELEKLLYNLVSINSTNLDYSDKTAGEEKIGDFVYEYFKKHNIDCIKQEVVNDRRNIIARIGEYKDRDTILFCSHLDTVYIEGMDFKPKVINGKMYGPGSCDTKASLAAMMNTFAAIKKTSKKIPNLYFVGVISEEILHYGIKKFLKEFSDFNSAVIGEPTNLDIGIAHKGYIRLKIKTTGKSAHGSTPDLGINAIYSMEKLINRIRTKLIPKYKNISHDILGSPTINVGKIIGGISFNIVPDSCIIYIDRRTVPGESYNDVMGEFNDLIKEFKTNGNNFFARIENSIQSAPYLETDLEEKVVKVAFKNCKKINKDTKIRGLSYTTDGGFLSDIKIPTIVLGPGDIQVCHRLGEFISLDQLNLASEIY